VTTAYALLRHNGVELGKSEYLRGQWAARGVIAVASDGEAPHEHRCARRPPPL